jgi:hypothetical protein
VKPPALARQPSGCPVCGDTGTVTHRENDQDFYGTTTRYVLATFTDRYPGDQRS